MQGLFNGFGAGSMNGTGQASNQSVQHFNHPQVCIQIFYSYFLHVYFINLV